MEKIICKNKSLVDVIGHKTWCLGLPKGINEKVAERIDNFLDGQILDFCEKGGCVDPVLKVRMAVTPYNDDVVVSFLIMECNVVGSTVAVFRIPKMAYGQRGSAVKIRAFFNDTVYEI